MQAPEIKFYQSIQELPLHCSQPLFLSQRDTNISLDLLHQRHSSFSLLLGPMTTLWFMMWCAVFLLVSLANVATAASAEDIDSSKETLAIKNKLATAEGRVSDLISRLDSVSDDASRAKSEIHNTLLEVWNVVDLLGKDQCGTVVEKVRVAQKKAESRVSQLEEEVRVHMKDIEDLKVRLGESADVISSLNKEIKAERTRREAVESEARDLRDKLHWAKTVSNETEKYEQVAERLQKLLVVVSERTILLNRISTMIFDAHEGFKDWQDEIKSLSVLVRKTERQFTGNYKSDAIDGLNRQIADLQLRLKNSLTSKHDVQRERDQLRTKLSGVEDKSSKRNIDYASGETLREPIIRQNDSKGSWIGWITFIIMSVGTGIVGTVMFNYWNQRPETTVPAAPAEQKFGFPSISPGQGGARVSPIQGAPSMSPLTFGDNPSGQKTPGSKNSTPRRY